MPGPGGQQEGIVAQRQLDHRVRRRPQAPDRADQQVDLALHQRRHHVIVQPLDHRDRAGPPPRRHLLQDRRHQIEHHAGRGADAQRSLDAAGLHMHLGLGVADQHFQRARPAQQDLAGRRQGRAARGAVEHRHAEAMLEQRDAFRQGRLGKIERRRGPVEGAVGGDGEQIGEVARIDRHNLRL